MKSVYREAKQFGNPYPSGSFLALNDTSTEIFPDYTYSDSDTESHTPANWSMIPNGLGTGYAYALGDFSIWCYVSSPPYNSYYVGNESCQPGVGGLPSS